MLSGLSADKIDACLNDKAVQTALVKQRADAETQFKVSATPSFVIDYGKETVAGAVSFDSFDKTLAKYVK